MGRKLRGTLINKVKNGHILAVILVPSVGTNILVPSAGTNSLGAVCTGDYEYTPFFEEEKYIFKDTFFTDVNQSSGR